MDARWEETQTMANAPLRVCKENGSSRHFHVAKRVIARERVQSADHSADLWIFFPTLMTVKFHS